MPELGGISAWISIGDRTLDEYDIVIEDDKASCYIEVPHVTHDHGIHSSTPSTPHQRFKPASHPSLSGSAVVDPLSYTINYRIGDLTYTLVVKCSIDSAIEIEKVHAGRGTLAPAKNVGWIEAVPVTDDWSKKRRLKFVPLTPSVEGEYPAEELGLISLAFYRAGRSNFGATSKSVATGFHKDNPLDPRDLVAITNEEGLKFRSHSTGLGPIEFSQPRKVLAVKDTDDQPYVTFTFHYLSRELLPDDWIPQDPLPTPNFTPNLEKDLPPPSPEALEPQPEYISGAPLQKRASITGRAKQWADGVRRGASSVRFSRKNKAERPKFEVVHPPSAWNGAERVPNIEVARSTRNIEPVGPIPIDYGDGSGPSPQIEEHGGVEQVHGEAE